MRPPQPGEAESFAALLAVASIVVIVSALREKYIVWRYKRQKARQLLNQNSKKEETPAEEKPPDKETKT